MSRLMKTYIKRGRKYCCSYKGRIDYRYARYIVEQALGHDIPSDYHVHHIDGNRLNDNINNLRLMASEEHIRLHNWDSNHEYIPSYKYKRFVWKDR